MPERTLRPADPRASSEARAILLATLTASLGSLIVNVIGHALVLEVTALERMMAHPAMAGVIAFVAAVWLDPKWMVLHACLIAWLGVVPAMMLLRVLGRLRLSTALPAGAILPLSTVSAVTLLMWNATSATTAEKFVVYGVLIAMTIPAAMAAAGAFWGVYVWAGGRGDCSARFDFDELEPRST